MIETRILLAPQGQSVVTTRIELDQWLIYNFSKKPLPAFTSLTNHDFDNKVKYFALCVEEGTLTV